MKKILDIHRSRGIALVTALIILLITTIIAISAVRYTTLGKRIALNDELRVSSFQVAQSAIDATITSADNTPVIGEAGNSFCTAGVSGCSQNNIILADNAFASDVAAGTLAVRVIRLDPPFVLPPRGIGTSLVFFTAASFSVNSTYDRSAEGLGRAQVNEGLLLVIPK